MPDTVFHCDSTPIKVSHHPCSDPIDPPADGLAIMSNDAERTVQTTISIGTGTERRRVYVYWALVVTDNDFELLYIPETETLFLGAGTLSATVHLRSMTLVHLNQVMLFWSFERRRDCILELGEVECFLYDQMGNQLGTVPADPPYDINETDDGINIVSPIYGSQWLRFPK